MKRERLHKLMQEAFEMGLSLAQRKNKDYANSEDALKNFRNSELAGVSLQRGILVRMMDKIARIDTLLDAEPAVAEERLEDTLLDLINYAAILRATIIED